MTSNPKISVIIPIYNCEKYILKSVNSLLCQTYGNLEIIVVNDGSTDNSLNKLKTAFKNNEQVKIIDKKNGGVSSARNAGINAANGDFIAFLDADDEYTENAFELMLSEFKEDTELLICSFNQIWIKTHCEIRSTLNITRDEFKDNLYKYYLNFNFVWANLYVTSIIKNNGIYFNEEITVAEDYDFNLRYINCCNGKLRACDRIVYNYYICRSNTKVLNDNPARSIQSVIDFYGGRENMPKRIYDETVSRFLKLCVRRYNWAYKKEAGKMLEPAFKDALPYADDEILSEAFTQDELLAIKEDDYDKLIKLFCSRENIKDSDKIKYNISKAAAKTLDKFRGIK